jgi:hypothetical protein
MVQATYEHDWQVPDDEVYKIDGQWYYPLGELHGPYETAEEAQAALKVAIASEGV